MLWSVAVRPVARPVRSPAGKWLVVSPSVRVSDQSPRSVTSTLLTSTGSDDESLTWKRTAA